MTTTETRPAYSARNTELLVSSIVTSDLNPRKTFDEAGGELTASIRQHGVLQPILVRPVGGQYVVVAGERRYRAALAAGLETIPVTIRELTDREHLEIAIVENLQRADLSPLETARGYRALLDAGMKQTEIAAAVNREQPAIAKSVGLLKLPDDVQQMIDAGELSPSHGYALAKFAQFPAVVSEIAAMVGNGRYTAKQAEERGLDLLPWQSGTVKRVNDYGEAREMFATCKACPFGAYRKGEQSGFCLKPEHFDELAKQIQDEKQVAIKAKLAEAGKDAGERPLLREFQRNQYERIFDYSAPAACKAGECPCLTQVIEDDGRVVVVCIDRQRYQNLERAATLAKNKARRARADGLKASADVKLEQIAAIGPREMALIVAAALERVPASVKDPLTKQYAGGEHGYHRDWWKKLAGVPVMGQFKLCLEALVDHEVKELKEYEREDGALTWWLDETPAAGS